MQAQEIKAISSEKYLGEIIDSGWSMVGPRKDPDKNLRSAKNFFKRDIAFVPEHVLKADGFKIVPPSSFTRGHQLMYKDDGKLIRYTKSQYTLTSGESEVPLYVFLREDETDL
ncbi:MAG: hypothetical protein SWH78_02245 [Thermodesulfobacteriota bacterium]|nr:hypothetical protein [Thermodesulfobacteriota bacterium]